ncbi:MAG: hypothetical protein ACE5G8_01960 [Anaerolineae bacterium]
MPAPYAEVVVNRPIVQRRAADSALPAVEEWSVQHETRLKRFHYHIPPHLAAHLQPGHLVAVPFRRQELQGVVVALSDDSPVEKTRPIHAILDPNPVVTPAQIALARWLANEYLAPLTTCLSYFLSPGANRRPVTVIEVISPPPSPPPTLTPREQALYLYLQQQAKPVPLEGLEAGVVAGLQAKRLVQKRATLSKPGVGPKIERTVELLISPDEFEATLDTLGRPSKQAAALQYLARLDDPLPTVQAVKEAVGCSDSPLKGLADKGWADYLPAQKTIVPAPGAALSRDAPPPQAQILARLQAHARPILQSEFEAVTGHSLRQAKPLFTARALAYFREPRRLALRLPRHAIPDAIAQLRGTERHAAVLNLLAAEDGPVWIGWIYAQTEATAKTLQDLARAQAIAFDEARRWRDPLAEQTFTLDRPPTLTPNTPPSWPPSPPP